MPTELSCLIQDFIRPNPYAKRWDKITKEMMTIGKMAHISSLWDDWGYVDADGNWVDEGYKVYDDFPQETKEGIYDSESVDLVIRGQRSGCACHSVSSVMLDIIFWTGFGNNDYVWLPADPENVPRLHLYTWDEDE